MDSYTWMDAERDKQIFARMEGRPCPHGMSAPEYCSVCYDIAEQDYERSQVASELAEELEETKARLQILEELVADGGPGDHR